MPRKLITLTTDFGLADGYVGTMKGVMLGICPEAELIDICHDIRPQAVRQGAYILSCAVPFFAPGTIHLAVIDPGVGGQRRPVLVQTGRATYIGPDNGLLSLVLVQDSPRLAIHLTNPGYRLPSVSNTFHGRDIFAPAAAYLAAGADPRDMGDPIAADSLLTLPIVGPLPQGDGSFLGEVLHVDRFGNLVTSFRCPHLPPRCTVEIAGVRIARLSRTFSDEATGTLLAYIGSSDHLEIAVRDGNAAELLGMSLGAPLRVKSQT
jgi:S-adenosylmethionine hydrolase